MDSAAAGGAPPAEAADFNGSPSLSRKPKLVGSLKGGHHLRKTWSGPMKIDCDDGGSGANLSRASSASLSFSCSFTGFTALPQDAASDAKAFGDNENAIDLEDGQARKSRMPEPTLPIHVKFTEVGYGVVLKGGITSAKEKGVLHGIRGSARPGELLAMMGPSGSGKTTLLSLLGGRLTGNSIQGSVTYNDEPYAKSLKCRIGFVTQDDVLFTHLTVKETLTYAALLRLPRTMTREQKEERASSAIHELGLEM
ncbi:ABC-2 type transporter [Musa troglodytarum]|uniref:ABC-2 type transporter n=1 Tax=Musa troglodytarum TaxID=320322 RepID=A0A9E7EC20_9LILI|nr:ABC-2 type transporter [Musa troglodytarum]